MVSRFKLGLLLSYLSMPSIAAVIITPALPFIQHQFNLSAGKVEELISLFLVGYVVGQLIYGPLANRFGRLFALRAGLIIYIIGNLLCLAAVYYNIYSLLECGRLISALGSASGLACTYMIINEWLPTEQRKTAMAYSIVAFTVGIGLAVSLGGIITEYWLWSGCFILLLSQNLFMFLGTFLFKETLKTPQPININTILINYKKALKCQTLVIFALAVGFCSIIGYCFAAVAPQIANDYLYLSAAQYGYWNLLNMLGMLIGGLWSRRLLAHYPALQIILVGLGMSVLGIASLLFMWEVKSHCPLWFFISTTHLYLFSSVVFAGATFIASNALADKASGSAMMSFINMGSATVAVLILSKIATNPLLAFVELLIGEWILITSLVLMYQLKKRAIQLN
ncbi:major facilitator superfamily (MFS) transporter [Legionella beliardensis]|uniref:Major facilitator superfamily (MFS) transporter n=1 Tax=Legionella beliardensis TaxID=91822 RepID=A0A378I0G6_9GAMM|nr:MFS transporter [Legionella beliardensis]STX28687.1 major facilitator superfamily (MFS) transporter [Legionella beliardensis]